MDKCTNSFSYGNEQKKSYIYKGKMYECLSTPVVKLNKNINWEVYKCQICTKIFYNRYDYLIHNTQHIIIPLLRMQFQKCKFCSGYFTSKADLKLHMCNNHRFHFDLDCKVVLDRIDNRLLNNTRQDRNFKRPEPNALIAELDNFELIDSKGIIGEVESSEQSEVNRVNKKLENSHLSKGNGVIVQVENSEQSENVIVIGKIEPSERYKSNKIVNNFRDNANITSVGIKVEEQPRKETHNGPKVIPVGIENIFVNSKIKFVNNKPLFEYEDDIVPIDVIDNNKENGLLQEECTSNIAFKNDVIVSLNMNSLDDIIDDDDDDEDDDDKSWFYKGNHTNALRPPDIGPCSSTSLKGDQKDDEALDEVTKFSPSIGYDDLVAGVDSECKRCGEIFQNRLHLIKHETSHMRCIVPSPSLCPYCDCYVANGRRILYTHVKRAHPKVIYTDQQVTKTCTVCGLEYADYERHKLNNHESIDEGRSNGNRLCSITKTVYVCELCYSFFKMKSNCKYVEMGDAVFKGRKSCERCGRLYFQLKCVKRVVTKRKCKWKQKKKPLSNTDKLREIYKRLKNMKYKSKRYYMCVLFTSYDHLSATAL